MTVTPNPVHQHAPDAKGGTFSFTIQLTETAGVATKLTGFTFGGVNLASSIASFFGSNTLPAKGTLSAALDVSSLPVPTTETIVISGQDASGAPWSKQISVPFVQ
jgi:hypothetical protein